jgi:hypothetical protein
MSDLETFRAETRAWLETNCPASMRNGGNRPSADDEVVWGGRKQTYKNAESVWRWRALAR